MSAFKKIRTFYESIFPQNEVVEPSDDTIFPPDETKRATDIQVKRKIIFWIILLTALFFALYKAIIIISKAVLK